MEFELFAHNFESLCRIQTMKAPERGSEAKESCLRHSCCTAGTCTWPFKQPAISPFASLSPQWSNSVIGQGDHPARLANGFAQELHNKLIKESVSFI